MGRSTGTADGGNDGLNCLSPYCYAWDIVGLVHDAEDDFGLAGVFAGKLRPETCKLSITWSALTYDFAIPASVVVDIDNAMCSSA